MFKSKLCKFTKCIRCDKYWHDCKEFYDELTEECFPQIYCLYCESCQFCGCCPCGKDNCEEEHY